MLRRSPRLLTVVTLCLLGMGGLALALVLFSAGIYRSAAYENRAAAVRDLLQRGVAARRAQAVAGDRVLALELARDPAFRSAWRAQSPGALRTLLHDRQVALPDGTAVRGIHVLDSSRSAIAGTGLFGCPPATTGPDAASAGGGTVTRCLQDGVPLRSVMVPLAAPGPTGFIDVVADPLITLARVGADSDLALRIARPGGKTLYQSDDWSRRRGSPNSLMARYLTPAKGKEPVFALHANADVGLLNQQLADTRDFVLLAAGTILAVALLAALVGLRRLMQPLRALQGAAEGISREHGVDEFEPVTESGPPEIATPIRSFNAMVTRVHQLVGNLEAEVGQRRDAETAAHRARELAESHALNASRAREFSHATLEAVVDAVIATDLSGRVEYLNPVAETLLGTCEQDAIGQPIDHIMAIHDRDGQPRQQSLVASCLQGDRETAMRRIGLLGDPAMDEGVPRFVDYAVVAMHDSAGATVGAVLIFHDVTEAERLTERLQYLATHDSLSGLINRYEFENRLQQVLTATQGGLDSAVLCYLDLDQFKVVNDTCGHVAGDELLRQLALLLGERLGERGILGRLGGDEFGLLIDSCTIPEARTLAEELRAAIQQFRFVWDERVFGLGVSIGVVAIDRYSASTEMLLSAADTACYMAKDAGRNRVQVYEPDDAALQQRHAEMQWVSEINSALEEDRFLLYCQEIVDAVAPEPVYHYEILLRMRDAVGNVWSPGSFLPAAERYDLAPAIDQWVVRQTLAWIAENPVPAKGLYSINLSGRSLAAEGFLQTILDEFEHQGVAPANICFEVTETAAIANLASARAFIDTLRALGCRFSLDDFGSGLSSFSYLQNLPVDFLKIDGAFVVDLPSNSVHQAIVRCMNDIGHAMGMYTIAEFAEDQTIIECLRVIGVDYVQGYGYGRPRPLQAEPPPSAEAVREQ